MLSKESNVTLSVIIIHYNNDQYIEECVESVFRQSYQDYEVIIVDDCSTNGQNAYLLQVEKSHPNVKVIWRKKNGGPSVARNEGILAARGEYITTLDGDDIYANVDKLKNEMALIEEHYKKTGEDIIAYSYIALIDENGREIIRKRMNPEAYAEGYLYQRFLSEFRYYAFPRDYCFRKALAVDAGLYDVNMRLYEDMDFLVRLGRKTKFFCTKEFGTGYRQTEKGLSAVGGKPHKAAKESIWNRYKANLPLPARIKVGAIRKWLAFCRMVRVPIRDSYRWIRRGLQQLKH